MKTERCRYRRIVWMAGAAIILVSSSGSSPLEGRQATESTLATLSGIEEGDSEVPFTMADGYLIVVEARIGERHRVKFALDTGATYSVLRTDLAKGLEHACQSVRVVNLDSVLTQEMSESRRFSAWTDTNFSVAHDDEWSGISCGKRSAGGRNDWIGCLAVAKFQHRFWQTQNQVWSASAYLGRLLLWSLIDHT